MSAPDSDEVVDYRLGEVERKISGLTEHAVSREWLEERQGRTDDAIASMRRELLAEIRLVRSELKDVRKDVDDITSTEKSRRLAVYAALVTGVVSLVSALVIVAMTAAPSGGL